MPQAKVTIGCYSFTGNLTILIHSREMGNSPAHVNFEFENNGAVCPGEKLKGKVLLDINSNIIPESLTLLFRGEEIAEFKKRKQGAQHTKHLRKSVDIYSSKVVLHKFKGGSVAKGHFEYPFVIAIPSGLPGSQCYTVSHSLSSVTHYCALKYSCKVKLLRSGKKSIKNDSEIFLLDEPYKTLPVPLFLGPSATKIYSLGTVCNGTIMFAGKVNASNACGNEMLQVKYAIHNESTSRVKALVVDLTCHIAVRAGFVVQHLKLPICNRRIDAAGISGVQPIVRIGNGKVNCNALLTQVSDAEVGIDIPIDRLIRSSYDGELSSVKYELSMTVITTCGSNNSTIRVPIIIHSRGADYAGDSMVRAAVVNNNPTVALAADYNTARGLTTMVANKRWQEIIVLKDWLAHSLNNINLLTPDTMFRLFDTIKNDSSIFAFCQALGEAMNAPYTENKCTCRHIAQAARGVRPPMKISVCNLFYPYCTDRQNAFNAFKVIGFTVIEMMNVMMNYK